jgi:serine/threonine-protein kinase HipA
LIYPDGRNPRLAPAYDFVSTIPYIADNRMALSIAREKATNRLTAELLERFAQKAQVPTRLVLQTAQETLEKVLTLWPKIRKELPLDRKTRDLITDHIRSIPLLH